MIIAVGLCIVAYFLGAISFAALVSRAKGVDLTQVGSGNLGATNVYRAMGLKYALLVFALDCIKAAIPTYVAIVLMPNSPAVHVLVGLFTIIGHSLSPYVKFKGGKGVAPACGVIVALSPPIFGIVFGLGALSIALFRYVAPVSLAGAVLTPLLFWWWEYPVEYVVFLSVIAGVIILRHKANIRRLIQGKENKI